MKNYKLDSTLLPEVWLTWENKNGSVYMNGKNGKRQYHPEDWMRLERYQYKPEDDGKIVCGCYWSTQRKPRIWVRSGSNLIYAYAKYHEDIERLEVAAVKYDTTRGEYAHEWQFAGNRFFIGKDKSCVLHDGNVFIDGYKELFKHNGGYNPRNVLQLLVRQNYNDNLLAEFKKFLGEGSFLIGNGTSVVVEHPWHIVKWYETVQRARSKGKQQKLADKLTATELSDASDFSNRYPIKQSASGGGWYKMKDIVYCEKVDDDWCVLRSFSRQSDDLLIEEWRMYICKDGTTRIVSKATDGWIPAKQSKGWRHNKSYLANKDEAMVICPRIKYILSSAKLKNDYQETEFLVTALRFPEIEQMCKLGCGNSAAYVASSHTTKADIKEMFGGYYNEKEKNFLRKIGMTKQQLDAYSEVNGEHDEGRYVYSEWSDALCSLREMFGNDLTYLDIDSFKKYLLACKEWRRFRQRWRNTYIFDELGLDLDDTRFFKNLVRLMNKRSDIFTVVYDAMDAYRYLRTDRRFNVDWYFDDVSDAVRVHDALVELKNLQWAEDRARYNMEAAERQKKEEAKRKKLDETRKIYEYEDCDFIIRLPKTANEIVYEGTAQHICIGGYVSRHSVGDTNLFFLRRKSEPDTPFYAIEMNNSNNIVQIHGFGNRWLGNNPEAIPTVVRWLRKHGIKCNKEILTCKATGYGMVREFVAMPVVD